MIDNLASENFPSTAQVQLLCDDQVVQTATATLKHWTKGAAVQKGVAALIITWVLALAALPVPIVHFVAVPLLLCMGPVIGLVLYKTHIGRTDVRVGESGLQCHDCQRPMALDSGIEQWPRSERCQSCGATFEVKLLT